MTTPLDGIAPELATADLDESAVRITLDAAAYPLQAIYGAAYVFIDRCYVFLDRLDATRLRVTLAAKKPPVDAGTLRTLLGEFGNELLSCAWRHQITQDNRAIIEAVTSQALSGAMGPPSIDDLANFDFTDEPFEDPHGIALSWEEKYKKSKTEGATAAPAADAAQSGEKTT